jgi:hypothetical protein
MNNRKQDISRCAKIEAIRLNAGGSTTNCPTCDKGKSNPYRRSDARGNIVEGCVDAFHEGALHLGESLRWHSRSEGEHF